jgi:hypothetical protein
MAEKGSTPAVAGVVLNGRLGSETDIVLLFEVHRHHRNGDSESSAI